MVKTTTLLCLTAGALTVSAEAVTLLSVDFGRDDALTTPGQVSATGPKLQDGFQGFYMAGNTVFTGVATVPYAGINSTFTSGTVSVSVQGDPANTLVGSVGGRDRGNPQNSGAFTYSNLLTDGIARTKQTSMAGEYSVSIAGLNPNAFYEITVWGASSGADQGTVYSWYDTSIGSNLIGSFVNGPVHPLVATSNTDYSVTGTVRANATGTLLLGVVSGNASPSAGYVNGFVLSSSAIPEPGATALAGIAGLLMLRRRRR